MKTYNFKKIGVSLLILAGIEFVISCILKNIVFRDISELVELWTMLFPIITTLVCAAWCLTETIRTKHPRRSIGIRIIVTYAWICMVAIGLVMSFM